MLERLGIAVVSFGLFAYGVMDMRGQYLRHKQEVRDRKEGLQKFDSEVQDLEAKIKSGATIEQDDVMGPWNRNNGPNGPFYNSKERDHMDEKFDEIIALMKHTSH